MQMWRMVSHQPILKIDCWLLFAVVIPSFPEFRLHSHETNSVTTDCWLLVTNFKRKKKAFGFPFQMQNSLSCMVLQLEPTLFLQCLLFRGAQPFDIQLSYKQKTKGKKTSKFWGSLQFWAFVAIVSHMQLHAAHGHAWRLIGQAS